MPAGAKEAVEAFGPSGRLVIDPPRTGLGLAAVEAAVRFGAERIAYVSCNPTTLGPRPPSVRGTGLHVVRATPVEHVPPHYHIETVAELERGLKGGTTWGCSGIRAGENTAKTQQRSPYGGIGARALIFAAMLVAPRMCDASNRIDAVRLSLRTPRRSNASALGGTSTATTTATPP